MILRWPNPTKIAVDPVVVGLELVIGKRPDRTETVDFSLAEIEPAHSRSDSRPEHAAATKAAIAPPVPALARRLIGSFVCKLEVRRALPTPGPRPLERSLQGRVSQPRIRVVVL